MQVVVTAQYTLVKQVSMAHVSKVVEVREINDEYVAYRLQCCGEAMTDSWHTLAVTVGDADHDTFLATKLEEVAAKHAAKQAAMQRAARVLTPA